ncbi:bifunctional peptidase and (3S)-lysyl hydroxylase Jmjd7-like [Haliotis asinina]|uniref:bifunctional peptidase and (3S)-lysyl hydroxylase Jmjd7-like n=1 Tax=Haliotis asinina TaxID=109174 RepID=UPI003531C7FA
MEAATVCALFVCILGVRSADPPGHLKPFGSHTVPHGVEVMTEFPTPHEFHEKFKGPGKPVLFKSVLQHVVFPPFRLWDDDYLRTKYGDIEVVFEAGKKETRNGDADSKKLREFLDIYKDQDIYLVEDLKKDMFGDMYIPRSLQCGGVQNHIETVVIWFSSGGTKSVIHNDSQDNINCLLDGTKNLVIFDRKYKDMIEADGFNADGTYSHADVDSIDMYKYPRIKDIPTFNATMEAGDCLYIPYQWYHQVNSFGRRNLAINIWFTHLPFFNDSDCQNVDVNEQTVPFSRYGFVNTFRSENVFFLNDLLEKPHVSKEMFMELLVKSEAEDKDAIFDFVDRDGDSSLSWDELFQIDVRDIIKRYGSSLTTPPSFFDDLKQASFGHDEL